MKKDKVSFVVNIPKYVPCPSQYSEDSSIFSLNGDQDLEARLKDFDEEDLEFYPYRTYDVQEKSPRRNAKDQDPKIVFEAKAGIGVLHEEIIRIQEVSNIRSNTQTLFDLMKANAFESQDRSHLHQVKVVIGLNRMKSLSSRNNEVLSRELSRLDDTDIRNEKFAFFWEPEWCSGKTVVNYDIVRGFYKKLKAYDKKHGTSKAKKFLDTNERGEFAPTPPYQDIREYVKDHETTATLILEARDVFEIIYYSFIDDDVRDFNGVYSAYFRILENSGDILPHVMSTGYEFHGNDTNYPYRFASHADRLIRVATAEEFQHGIYYPEPNFCVLLPAAHLVLPYSFLDHVTYPARNMESPVLVRNLLKEIASASLIFADDNYVIIETPERAKYSSPKKRKSGEQRKFSRSFHENLVLEDSDVTQLADITQSTLDPMNWAKGLCYNNSFKVSGDRGVSGKFRGYMTDLRDTGDKSVLIYLESIVQPITIVSLLENAAQRAFVAKDLLLHNCNIDKDVVEVEFKELIQQMHKLSLSDLMKLANIIEDNSEIFYLFVNYNIELLDILKLPNDLLTQEVHDLLDDIDLEELVEIYHNNNELFYAMISDPEGLIERVGAKEFIQMFEASQEKIEMLSNDDPYKSEMDPYELVKNEIINDWCPDSFCRVNSDSISSYVDTNSNLSWLEDWDENSSATSEATYISYMGSSSDIEDLIHGISDL